MEPREFTIVGHAIGPSTPPFVIAGMSGKRINCDAPKGTPVSWDLVD